jgi:TatD family-associated radical SAM protein
MANIIVYPIENNLYVNLTNRCSNACEFCVRTTTDFSIGYDLWLENEPTVDEVVEEIKAKNPDNYKELVFCGYGEPTERFEDMTEIIRRVKKFSDIKIRLNTNGHANLIAGRDVTAEMKGLIDTVSISLNEPDAVSYQKICHCEYGEAGFDALLDFAKKAKEYVPHVMLSIVDIMDKDDIEKCRKIAEGIGVDLRIRELIK